MVKTNLFLVLYRDGGMELEELRVSDVKTKHFIDKSRLTRAERQHLNNRGCIAWYNLTLVTMDQLKTEEAKIKMAREVGMVPKDWIPNGYMDSKQAKKRLEYLRGEIKAERISYGELAELEALRSFIAKDDVELWGALGREV